MVVLVNQTELLVKNIPFYFIGASSLSFGISSTFVNSTFGGVDGNCLIGLRTLSISGNYSGTKNRSVLFDAKVYPGYAPSIVSAAGDAFVVGHYVVCFNFLATCPALTFFNPTSVDCLPCSIVNCTTCLLYNVCQTCNQYTLWVAAAV